MRFCFCLLNTFLIWGFRFNLFPRSGKTFAKSAELCINIDSFLVWRYFLSLFNRFILQIKHLFLLVFYYLQVCSLLLGFRFLFLFWSPISILIIRKLILIDWFFISHSLFLFLIRCLHNYQELFLFVYLQHFNLEQLWLIFCFS